MACEMGHGVARRDGVAQGIERRVLGRLEPQALQAFEFYADGVVVAAVAAPPAGSACMPGARIAVHKLPDLALDRKSTRLNSSHLVISYAVFCLKKKNTTRAHLICYTKHDA